MYGKVTSMKLIDVTTPCQSNPDLWFEEDKESIEKAKGICNTCPFKEACLAQAEKEKEVWGVWGGKNFNSSRYQSTNKARGLCRNGKHDLPNGGRCAECRKATRAAHDKRRAERRKIHGREKDTRTSHGKKHKNKVGGTCKSGHNLTTDNTKIRPFDGAVMCKECYSKVKPKMRPSRKLEDTWRF